MAEVRVLTRQDDLSAVGNVYAQSWKHSYCGLLPQPFLDKLTGDRWIAMLRAEPEMSLGLFEEGCVIGTAMISFGREPEREGFGEIVSLYLLPEAMGFGHGRRLMEAALKRLREEGCEQVCLWVFRCNEYAIGFYEHVGFRHTGRTQWETFGGKRIELVELVRDL